MHDKKASLFFYKRDNGPFYNSFFLPPSHSVSLSLSLCFYIIYIYKCFFLPCRRNFNSYLYFTRNHHQCRKRLPYRLPNEAPPNRPTIGNEAFLTCSPVQTLRPPLRRFRPIRRMTPPPVYSAIIRTTPTALYPSPRPLPSLQGMQPQQLFLTHGQTQSHPRLRALNLPETR